MRTQINLLLSDQEFNPGVFCISFVTTLLVNNWVENKGFQCDFKEVNNNLNWKGREKEKLFHSQPRRLIFAILPCT